MDVITIMKYIKFTALCAFCLFLFACASSPTDPASMFPDKNATALFVEGQNLMMKGSCQDAIQRFESFEARYPFSEHAEQVLVDSIYCYNHNYDTASALAAADRYVRLYPRGKYIAYAYYMRGLINFEQNRGFIERHVNIDFQNVI